MQMHNLVLIREVIINSFPVNRMRELISINFQASSRMKKVVVVVVVAVVVVDKKR